MENHINTTPKSRMPGNIVFLLISFPLGLTYFMVVVTGISLGLGTLVIWIGLPILFTTMLLIHGMAEIERRMVSSLLHIPVPHQLREQHETGRGFLRRFGRLLSDPYTWTGMIYMFMKLPIGILSFVLALTLPIVSAAVTLMPLVYLVNLFVNLILLKNGVQSTGYIIPYFIEVHGQFDLVMFARSFIGIPVGLALWFATRFLLNGLARVSGELALAMLGRGKMDTSTQAGQSWTSPAFTYHQHPSYEEQYASQERSSSQR